MQTSFEWYGNEVTSLFLSAIIVMQYIPLTQYQHIIAILPFSLLIAYQ